MSEVFKSSYPLKKNLKIKKISLKRIKKIPMNFNITTNNLKALQDYPVAP